jgi:hypothetical protein
LTDKPTRDELAAESAAYRQERDAAREALADARQAKADSDRIADESIRLIERNTETMRAVLEERDQQEHWGNILCGLAWDIETHNAGHEGLSQCAFCGESSIRVGDELRRHIERCEKHPMADLRREVTGLTAERDAWKTNSDGLVAVVAATVEALDEFKPRERETLADAVLSMRTAIQQLRSERDGHAAEAAAYRRERDAAREAAREIATDRDQLWMNAEDRGRLVEKYRAENEELRTALEAKVSADSGAAALRELGPMVTKLAATEAALADARKRLGEGEGFIGPCAHGRDPYDRCDLCGGLAPHVAAVAAEREACAALVEFADLFWHTGDPRIRIAAAIRARKP